jgi:hypothetical protein
LPVPLLLVVSQLVESETADQMQPLPVVIVKLLEPELELGLAL